MAYATIQSTAGPQYSENESGDQVINLPSSISTGDLLFAVCSYGSASGSLSTPSGWTEIARSYNGSASPQMYLFGKIAGGSEGSTLTVTRASGTGLMTCRTYRVTGHYNDTITNVLSGTSHIQFSGTNADPPSHTAAWGSKDNLWVTFYSMATTSGGTNPSGWTDIAAPYNNSLTPAYDDAYKTSTNATEDPDAWSNGSYGGATITAVIRPAESAVTGYIQLLTMGVG